MTTDPTGAQHSSAATATLPIDEHVDGLFDGLYDAGFSDAQRAHFRAELDALEEEVRNLGLGRKLIRLHREQQRLDREERLFLGQIAEARRRLGMAAREIEMQFEALALEHREAKLGNSMEIVGVGVWSTRAQPARWAVDNDAAMEAMDADQLAEFTELPEPKPPERKLRGPDFRRFLSEQHLDPKGNVVGELPPGVERVKATIGVSYDLYD